MRALVAFLLSFVLVGTVGALILPGPHPRAKPKPPAGSGPISATLDFLPEIPSLAVPRIDDTSKRYEQAWRLLKAGRWRAAERAYLQIVIRSRHDEKGMQGLVILQRLFANEDPTRLQEQAEAYRRAIAEGRSTANQYTPREMELLAEASLLAVNKSTAEQNLKLSAHLRVAIRSDLRRPISPPHTNVVQDPVSSIKERFSQIVSSLGLAPTKPDVHAGALVADSHHIVPPSITQTPRFPGDGNRSGGAIDAAPNSVTATPQGGTTDPGGDAGIGGPFSAGSQSNSGANDSSREGGHDKDGSSSGGSGGSTGSGGSGGASGNSGSGNSGSGGASAGSGGGGGSGSSAGGGASGAGAAGGSSGSAGKDGGGKGGSDKGGAGKGGAGKGGKD